MESVDSAVFERSPLLDWAIEFRSLLARAQWPTIQQLDELRASASRADGIQRPQFVAQSASTLADGCHYEERIACGRIATREQNWHDLLNALVWLRYPRIKQALNAAQCRDIARIGQRQRTRSQCAMTHFDEGGAVVLCSDPKLLELWDQHDWHGLFWREREAWGVRIAVQVFGHAVLELALQPDRLLLAKSIVLLASPDQVAAVNVDAPGARRRVDARIAVLIANGQELADPQDLRPLPLSGIPGWHMDAVRESFFHEAACFRPLRAGRIYPVPSEI